MFENLEDYPQLRVVYESWREILAELEALPDTAFLQWPEKGLYHGDWRVFPLYKFDEKIEDCCAYFPRTVELIESIDGLYTAAFSKLMPGALLNTHPGYSGDVFRFHVGLNGGDKCGFIVDGERKNWYPGSALLFDDTRMHMAWNRGTEERVVLLVDFRRNPHKKDISFNKPIGYGLTD